VPAGIGDFSWIYSKLVNLGISLDVQVSPDPPARNLPYAQLLPAIAVASYGGYGYRHLKPKALPAFTTKHQLLTYADSGERVCLEANGHVEAGRRIEQYLPDLPTSFHYEVRINDGHVNKAEAAYATGKPYVLVYASSMGTVKAWRGWVASDWVHFMVSLRHRAAEVPFVLTGAGWDADLGAHIEQSARHAGLNLTNLVGKTHIASTLHLMRKSSYFVSFPSGLGILANVINVPSTMLYPPQIQRIMGTWSDPETVKSNRFKECLFCPPDVLAEWIQAVYGLRDKLG
jgi:hypothetical protein